ncbi:hypothetical protein BK816_04510 [Boudabousia tangfeifanii]|uniref:Metallo-beta-lactamase domain-containing protein n=1 Tax=Boudabousia tangfeifanii TaxID=1912795 RepID=A0A1D9MKA2_9ACTO|nr:MBL fold metallo-hydrolase [Boudabousia tangfeifanii]AOZ72648.1 hypothetical protein BK816_04510 [Boudabousia tangfeifanii]
MQIKPIIAPVLGENCYVLFDQKEAVVIDPGAGVVDQVKSFISEQDLHLNAVVLTHGHADHCWSAGHFDVPVYVSEPDRYRLDDPLGTTNSGNLQLTQAFAQFQPYQLPEEIRTFSDATYEGGAAFAPGIVLRAIATPGHTQGSTMLMIGGEVTDLPPQISGAHEDLKKDWPLVVFSGDHIFAGGIGRTDLPGSDQREMWQSLRFVANALDPQALLLPGHGPATLWRHELATNPYVRQARSLG